MLRIFLACFLLSPFLMHFQAVEGPCRDVLRLKVSPIVRVGGGQVTLLHLFEHDGIPQEWQQLMASQVIGDIPLEAGRKYVHARELEDFVARFFASHGMGPDKFEMAVPEQIIVERVPASISREEIVDLYKRYLLEVSGRSREDLVLTDVECAGSLELPPGKRTGRVVAAPGQPHMGRVKLTVEFRVDGRQAAVTQVSGTVDWLRKAVYPVRPLKKGSIVSLQDIEERKAPASQADRQFVTDPVQAAGKQVLRDLDGSHPIEEADLAPALVLRRGDNVTIVYETPGLKVTARGQARQNGVKGQVIKVVNAKSNRTLDCRVVDSETVEAVP